MKLPNHSFWHYFINLWPLMVVFLLAQGLMRFSGNATDLGISSSLSVADTVVFFVFFCMAAWWIFHPLRKCLMLSDKADRHRRKIEVLMADFPWRALKAYLIAGWAFAIYLVVIITLVATASDQIFTWRMFIALALNFCFGAGVLASALAVAISIVYSARLRLKLSQQGWFLGVLSDTYPNKHITSASRRPWLVFLVTGLLPTLILAVYVWLALAGTEGEQNFILSQALVLLAMSITSSLVLVQNISRTLNKVTSNLERGLQALASGNFKSHIPVLLDDDMGVLARGLNTAMQGLQERDDLKDSLALAAEIQQGLLPHYDPMIPNYQLKGFQQTCYAVGGDYYDYIKLDDERIWLMVADVSGKGYPAALTMASLQAMLRGLATLNWPIEEAANYLNEALCDTLAAGRFVTLFMGKLQPESHSLVWVNAGHVPTFLLHDGEITRMEASAPPLGLVKGLQYEISRTELSPGDLLVAYTDGVTETSNGYGNEMYGEARFCQWLKDHADAPVHTLPEQVLDELNRFGRDGQDDDLTLLFVRREK